MLPSTTRTLAVLLALSTPACSLVFGGSRYTGGGPEVDAATPVDLDAFGEPPDAFVPIGVDANLDAAVLVDDDAGPRTCSMASECLADEYCDLAMNLCAPCDFDHDGLPHSECVRHMDGEAWDCEPRDPIVVHEHPTVFAHTLRLFLGDTDVHVLYSSAVGTRDARFTSLGTTEDTALASPPLSRFDARRVSSTHVAVVGYDGAGLHRYEIRDGGLTFVGTRRFSDLTAYPGIMPAGPIALVDAGENRAFVGFGGNWAGEVGRAVVDVGGVAGGTFTAGTHAETFYGPPGVPDATLFATGSGVALLPNDSGASNPFWMWAGDVRARGANFGLDNLDFGTMVVGQLAVARVGTSIVAFAGIGTGGGVVRLGANLAPCGMDGGDCTFLAATAIPITVDGMTERTIAVFPTSDHSLTFATTTNDAFLLGNLQCPSAGCMSVPGMISTKRIAAPAMDTREVALELRQDSGADRITIGLARASDTAIQMARFDVCLPSTD